MKFVVLLLLSCCAVALARPDGSKEVTSEKHGSKEVKHSGEGSKGSGESKENSGGSSEGSSNESGRKDGGGGILSTTPGIILPEPTIQQVELLLDHAVKIATSYLGPRPVNDVRQLVALVQSNPLGSVVWNLVIHPYLQNIVNLQGSIISMITQFESTIFNLFPFLHLFFPLELPGAIIHFVASILSSISKIFTSI